MPLVNASVPPLARISPWFSGLAATVPKPDSEAASSFVRSEAENIPPPSWRTPLLLSGPAVVKLRLARMRNAPLLVAMASIAAKTEPGPLSVTSAALVTMLMPLSMSVELVKACQDAAGKRAGRGGPERLVTCAGLASVSVPASSDLTVPWLVKATLLLTKIDRADALDDAGRLIRERGADKRRGDIARDGERAGINMRGGGATDRGIKVHIERALVVEDGGESAPAAGGQAGAADDARWSRHW